MLANARPVAGTSKKVLIVTGALIDGGTVGPRASQRSLSWWWNNVRAQLEVLGSSRQAVALALHGKLSFVEHLFHWALEQKLSPPPWSTAPPTESQDTLYVTVTEVVLATLLAKQGIDFEAASIDRLAARRELRERLLRECAVVFISSTLLLDLTELEIVARLVKRPWNKVVVGGTLLADLHHRWEAVAAIDVLAIGYGELLVPSLAEWMRADYSELRPPPTGRLRSVGTNLLLYSGAPASKSLDELPSPDWSIAMAYYGRRISAAGYESVRGCPYRCGFCDYPFLFDDNKFRMRSAEKIADDWQQMAEQGIEFISCLDSLFTMPKRRLVRLCELLIQRDVKIEWLCYARADDLDDPAVTRLMYRAGCRCVNIGIESGSQRILDNMDKRCTVEANAEGIRNARAAGIRVTANFIVGFPGETAQTIADTLAFIDTHRPDSCGVYPLNLGSARAPIMSEHNRRRFGLRTKYDGRVQNPHWSHDTMSAVDAIDWAHWLRHEIMKKGAAVDQALAGGGTHPRDALLFLQKSAAMKRPLLRTATRALRACTSALARAEMRWVLRDGPADRGQGERLSPKLSIAPPI